MTSTELDNDGHIQKRRIINKVTISVQRGSDSDDIQSSNQKNIEYIKRDVKEMIDFSSNTMEYHPDGLIEITPNYLQPIPNEIIQLIIQYLLDNYRNGRFISNTASRQKDLYELTLVSKQFYDLTNYLLWKTPHIPNAATLQRFQNSLTIAQLNQLLTSPSNRVKVIPHNIIMPRHHVRELSMMGDHWNDIEFTLMMPHFSLLEQLSIINTGDRISAASLLNFPRHFPHLTVLTLRIGGLTQNCIDTIARHCHQIRELELPCYNLPRGTFKALADNGSSTTNLHCLRFDHLHSSLLLGGGDDFLSTDMIKHMTRFNNLMVFSFHGMCPSPPKTFFTATTSKGAPAWPSLVSLFIDDGNRLDEPSFVSFIKSHPRIRCIKLGMSHISDATLEIIATHLPGLYSLTVQQNKKITATAVYRLVQRCPYLQKTNFSACSTLISSMPELSKKKGHLTIAELATIRQRGDQ